MHDYLALLKDIEYFFNLVMRHKCSSLSGVALDSKTPMRMHTVLVSLEPTRCPLTSTYTNITILLSALVYINVTYIELSAKLFVLRIKLWQYPEIVLL